MAAQRKYDWEGLFRRYQTTLVRGRDYDCSQSTMVGMIRNHASRRGMRVRVVDEGDSIIVEVKSEIPRPDKAPVAG